jgi:hypothetical protein
MHPTGLPPGSGAASVSAGQEPVLWAWLDLNQRPHPDPKIHGEQARGNIWGGAGSDQGGALVAR